MLAIGIAAAIIILPRMSETVEPYYITDPAVRLEKTTGYISSIDGGLDDYLIILGYSEYPLVIKKDTESYTTVSSNSSDFVADFEQKGESYMIYSNDNEVKTVNEPGIIIANIGKNSNTIFWVTGKSQSNNCTLKMMQNGVTEVITDTLSDFVNLDYPVFTFWNSDDGNAVVWYEDYNEENETLITYLYKDGKTAPLGKNIEISVISDNADKIFYEQYDKFYVQNGFDYENRILIAQLEEEGSKARVKYHNSDYSQIIYSVYGEDVTQIKSYYYEYGKEPVFLADGLLNRETPTNSEDTDDLRGCYYTAKRVGHNLDVYYFGDTFERVFFKKVDSIFTLSGTKNLLYETDKNLFLYDSQTGESVSVFEKTNEITYEARSDLSEIYVSLNNGNDNPKTLYSVKPNGEKTVISENVFDFFLVDHSLYYITSNGELFITENGQSKKLITFDEKEIIETRCGKDPGGYYFIEITTETLYDSFYDDSVYYISTDGKNFVNTDELE
jgi:hypothetical protein